MMKKTLVTAIALSIANIALAEDHSGQWYLNPMVGHQKPDSERRLNEDVVYGLGVEYQYNESWGTELKYLQGSMDSEGVPGNDADMKHLLLEGIYNLNALGNNKFTPYLALGLGHQEYDYDLSGENGETTATFGPGFRYAFSDRWSTKVDYRLVHALDYSENDGLFTIALSYAFGKTAAKPVAQKPMVADADKDGVIDSQDQCPNSAMGVSVDSRGCELDSDGDGVVNSKDQCPNTVAGAKVDAKGCAEKLTRTETIVLNVSFASSSAQLTDNFMPEVEKAAAFMRKYSSVTAVIEGHTDSSGGAAFNQRLSQRRAEAVRDVLINQFGIAANRLTAVGYGEDRPVADNSTVAGRKANRRVAAVFKAQVTE
ncbi:OmpA family protein [Dasania sp. GY-MA-18]|uniref:OmpA family protein n=1 Tax=Dasania phycosphaerae TaxID=2950436 RepID=A0A9J6RH57_9GAMM|nr:MULTISPECIES: OmpA family protein [Dasania]MCR8921188.1 OmpA family protein [Dasania sp. GY-MA-18]MCZ0863616.1 OmpA family protein [Dasania phycosphaerae]MCZ0867344.1 OmpA family protein [Dasania phycosphaerae]